MDLNGLLAAFGGAGNPHAEGLLSLVAADNPNVAAAIGASSGQPPPPFPSGVMGGANPGLGSLLDPMGPASLGDPTAMPGLAAMGGGGPMGQAPQGAPGLGSMAGVKAPQAAAPIMPSGSAPMPKATEVNMSAGNNIGQLLQLLQQSGKQPMIAKPLGSYLG